MLMLMTAAASAASSRRSQWTYDAEPDGQPVDDDLEHAADRVAGSSAPRRSGRSSRPRRPGPGSAAATRRPRRATGSRWPGRRATPPTSAVNDQASIPSSRRNARATPPAATRAAVSRADARSSTLRTSLKPYLSAPARSAWPGRTRVTGVARLLPLLGGVASSAAVLVVERLDLHDLGPVLPVAVADQEQDRRAERRARGGRPPRISARSCSIAWRAPRP